MSYVLLRGHGVIGCIRSSGRWTLGRSGRGWPARRWSDGRLRAHVGRRRVARKYDGPVRVDCGLSRTRHPHPQRYVAEGDQIPVLYIDALDGAVV